MRSRLCLAWPCHQLYARAGPTHVTAERMCHKGAMQCLSEPEIACPICLPLAPPQKLSFIHLYPILLIWLHCVLCLLHLRQVRSQEAMLLRARARYQSL